MVNGSCTQKDANARLRMVDALGPRESTVNGASSSGIAGTDGTGTGSNGLGMGG